MTTGRLRPPPPPVSPTDIADRTLSGARVHVDVVVPRTAIRGAMRLLSRSEVATIKAAARKHFTELGLPNTPVELAAAGHLEEWNNEIGVRTLAFAMRDAGDVAKPLADLAEWRECDDDQIAGLWRQYQDHADAIDPLGEAALTEAEHDAIAAAVKKKDVDRLMPFGSRRLSLYMLSTAAPPVS